MAVTIPGPADFLTGLIENRLGGDQSQLRPRNAMVFTSTLRQIFDTRNLGSIDVGVGGASQIISLDDLRQRAAAQDPGNALAFISMAVNPKSVRFSQPKRFKRTDTREGSVFFHFSNSKGQNNDILTISFAGNTGNIDLRGTLGDLETQQQDIEREIAAGGSPVESANRGPDTGALNKLFVWQNLYALTREAMIIGDTLENVFTITYGSAVLPITIDFHGFFNQVMNWEDSGEKPNSRDYDFEFTVTSTSPDLDDYIRESLAVLQDASLNVPSGPNSGIPQGGIIGG
jgi:hypothetical protein